MRGGAPKSLGRMGESLETLLEYGLAKVGLLSSRGPSAHAQRSIFGPAN